MSKTRFGHRHFVTGLDPVADALAGTVTSDAVNMALWGLAEFIIHKGVGTTGTSTITLEACSDAAGTGAEAIAFPYQAYTSSSDDTPGAVTEATASGFALTAGSSQLYVAAALAERLPDGKTWVRLKATEVVDAAVLAGILIELSEPRYAAQVPASAI